MSKPTAKLCCIVNNVGRCRKCSVVKCAEHSFECQECGINCNDCNSVSSCSKCNTDVCRFCMRVDALGALRCVICYEEVTWDDGEAPRNYSDFEDQDDNVTEGTDESA